MNTGGVIFMALSWALVLGMFIFSYVKVLREK
jgi:hypothetical protein